MAIIIVGRSKRHFYEQVIGTNSDQKKTRDPLSMPPALKFFGQ
jgi:hypothetical protein